jgi:8-oxo-dGTP pyrophosphatase MutT (NUDIX family)
MNTLNHKNVDTKDEKTSKQETPTTLKIVSAGGFLFDFEKEKVLLLKANHQHGNIVVPKGKINLGETPEQTALREVAEETGYDDIELIAPVGENNFGYVNKIENCDIPIEAKVEKVVHYFLFRLKSDHQTMAREAHEDFENIWASFDEAQKILNYKEDKELLIKAVEIYKNL